MAAKIVFLDVFFCAQQRDPVTGNSFIVHFTTFIERAAVGIT